jgi:hypothetical protein
MLSEKKRSSRSMMCSTASFTVSQTNLAGYWASLPGPLKQPDLTKMEYQFSPASLAPLISDFGLSPMEEGEQEQEQEQDQDQG